MSARNFFTGMWLFVFGVLILTKTTYPTPIESIIKISSLMNQTVDLSCLRPHAECIFLTLGIGYIVASVSVMHASCFGTFLAVLLELFMSATVDCPLFSLGKCPCEKFTLLIAHILIISVLLASDASAAPAKPKKVEEADKEIEGKAREDKKKSGKKQPEHKAAPVEAKQSQPKKKSQHKGK